MTKEGAEQRGTTDVNMLICMEVVENGQQIRFLWKAGKEGKQEVENTYDIV